MKRENIFFVKDIIENINLIEKSIIKITKKNFKSNKLLIDAAIRRLEIIGEAVKNLPIDFITKYPEVQWKDISGFRDVMVHGYFGVDLDKVWEVIKEDLPTLKKQIQKIKNDLEDLE
ncbi:MAG: DUF86 domain-containing protein [Nanoarchaeota archaeon]